MFFEDPLKIYYIVVLEDYVIENFSPFQGFSPAWRHVLWALHQIASLPADVLESAAPLDLLISQRMGGARQLSWLPLDCSALQQVAAANIGPFIVCFSGTPSVAEAVQAWISAQNSPILHISSVAQAGAVSVEDFSIETLKTYCREAFTHNGTSLSPSRREVAESVLKGWPDRHPVQIGLKAWGHNVVLPNQMVLRRAERVLAEGEQFVGRDEDDYGRIIVESAEAVIAIRNLVGLRDFHRAYLVHPALILTEPALFRHMYARPENRAEWRQLHQILRVLQTQRGHLANVDEKVFGLLQTEGSHQTLLYTRQWELDAHTLGVGLHAAQTCSAVVRLSPAVNHVFPSLSAYARNIRSANAHARRKARRLFGAIQHQLVDAIGAARLELIKKSERSVKIVADAPIEWLPVGNLPLGLRFDCSRINATPGNLMMGLLTAPDVVTLPIEAVQKVLVLSCFAPDDPIRAILVASILATREQWDGKVDVVFKRAQTRAEFVEALNAFDGSILIFDGHGAINNVDPIGYLVVGREKIDVWELRGHVRVPPIVVLSACDTQGIDSSTHATAGNGFLALGARTVLATLLPIDARVSGSFVARLIYRLADFLPAMIGVARRAINWTEIISGMLRMLFASEILDELVGPPAAPNSARGKIQTSANVEINSGDPEWFDKLIGRVAAYRNQDVSVVMEMTSDVIARCEAIRYVQLGNPETILIDDGRVSESVFGDILRRVWTDTDPSSSEMFPPSAT